ncbi:MAG: hypothetical protein HOG49_43210 [Candidatus Scalindua sp.]|nr:hypothetical protein [Candidatus Scalindua sp.]
MKNKIKYTNAMKLKVGTIVFFVEGRKPVALTQVTPCFRYERETPKGIESVRIPRNKILWVING